MRTTAVLWALTTLALALATSPGVYAKDGAVGVEGEALVGRARSTSGRVVAQDMRAFGRGWSGNAHLSWVPPASGHQLTLLWPVEQAGVYDLFLTYTRAANHADFIVFVGGKRIGEAQAGYAERAVTSGRVALGRVRLNAGVNAIVITGTGKDRRSSGFVVGIDRLDAVPASATPQERPPSPTQPSSPAPGAGDVLTRAQALATLIEREGRTAEGLLDLELVRHALAAPRDGELRRVALADALGRLAVLKRHAPTASTTSVKAVQDLEGLLFAMLAGRDLKPTPLGSENGALRLRWTGQVDTEVDFAQFFDGDHTVSVRFLAQYPYAFRQPLLSVEGSGTYWIGLGEVPSGGGGETAPVPPRLEARIGGQVLTWRLRPDVAAGAGVDPRVGCTTPNGHCPHREWHHLVVSRRGNEFRFYMDGIALESLSPLPQGTTAATLTLAPGDPQTPRGRLRVGRLGSSAPNPKLAQFFGLVDDLALYRYGIGPTANPRGRETVFSLYLGPRLDGRLTGLESGLWAGWTFDDAQGGRLSAQSTPLRLSGSLTRVVVSAHRASDADRKLLPQPYQQAAHDLPTPRGEWWVVVQGSHQPDGASHQGFAAFTLDLVRAPAGTATRRAPLYATAPGRVSRVEREHPSGLSRAGNVLLWEVGPGEQMGIIHLEPFSIPEELAVGTALRRGQFLGVTGNTGLGPQRTEESGTHLHLGVSDSAFDPMVTLPWAVRDYEVSTDLGKSHARVALGVPSLGQWVRRPALSRDLAASFIDVEQRSLGPQSPGVIDTGRPTVVGKVRNSGTTRSPAGRQVRLTQFVSPYETIIASAALPELAPGAYFEITAPAYDGSALYTLEIDPGDDDPENDRFPWTHRPPPVDAPR